MRQLACLETHIKSFHRVGQRTHGDEVHTLFGIVADGIEGDAAAGLCLVTTGDDVNSLLGVGHGEVVEHDTVDATMIEYLLQLVKRAYLYLNL